MKLLSPIVVLVSVLAVGLQIYHPNSSGPAQAQKLFVDVRDYGAVGDGQVATDCSTISGSAVITCSTSHFSVTDVGKVIILWQGGKVSGNYIEPLSATITSYQSNKQVTLSIAAGFTKNPSLHTAWGTDNQTAVAKAISQSACAKLSADDTSGCTLYFPAGHYMLQTVEFPCGAIGTFGSFTCKTMARNVTVAGVDSSSSTIEEWDGNVSATACSAYAYGCGLIFFGRKSTNDGAMQDASHYVNGVTIKNIGLILPPFSTGTYFKEPHDISLDGTMNAEVYNTFVEGSWNACIGGGGTGVVNSNIRIHDNYLRFCGWGGPAYSGSQAALNTVVPYVKIYNNTVYYSGQCIEMSAPFAEILNNNCEAKDDLTGAVLPYPTVGPQICLNFGSATYGYWNMVAKGNTCKDYLSGGNVSNSIGVMSNIRVEDNIFINSQGFALQEGREGITTGWPNKLRPAVVHGTSYFTGNKFVFDPNFSSFATLGIIVGSAREQWIVDKNEVILPGGAKPVTALLFRGTMPGWMPSHSYTKDPNAPSIIQPSIPNGYWYAEIEATGTCTSSSSLPTFPTTIGNTVRDGTCTWTNRGMKPIHSISNLTIKFPPGSTNNQFMIWNQGILPSDFVLSNIITSGGLISGVAESGFNGTASFGLAGFPPSWSSSRILREGIPYGNSNIFSSDDNLPTGSFYRSGDTIYTNPRTGMRWQILATGWHAAPWVASHSYLYNDIIQAITDDGHVFVALGACRSGSSEPSWNTGSGATTLDKAGGGTCSWKEAGADARIRQLTPQSSMN